ncbi:MAG TPA: TetR/AcrR family transcriptional regulator [Burkholderiales bacterium]|nr:TetR/AcrR family transcriptional regulator [Burkholderiales bacterium]
MPTPALPLAPAAAQPAARLALRERNKLDKRERIRSAAAEQFTREGYANATLRDIARDAGVGLGTLFNYAADKRDLVFLIFNEELGALTDQILAAPPQPGGLLEQLMPIFRAHYGFFAERPALARILLQELTFYSEGKHATEFHAIRKRLIDGVARRVAAAQAAGQLKQSESPELVARLLFFVYSASLRWWIAAPEPRAEAGAMELRRLLQLQMDGLTA